MNLYFTESELPEGWLLLSNRQSISSSLELRRETDDSHELHGLNCKALARREGRDDFLFEIEGAESPLYVIHLTWNKETSSGWPRTMAFARKEEFKENWRKIYD